MWLSKMLPLPELTIELTLEELALYVLECINDRDSQGDTNTLMLNNFIGELLHEKYCDDDKGHVMRAISEAWCWLENEGMIAPRPEVTSLFFVTRKGKLFLKESDTSKYMSSKILNKETLDLILASKVHPLFMRGDYDTAVFQAFKEVEIRVRTAASLPQKLVGTELMRKAFNPSNGKLTDFNSIEAERESTSHLFAGAIGLFKNPASHRDVNWEDPKECAELIYLANHLLRIAENRRIILESTHESQE